MGFEGLSVARNPKLRDLSRLQLAHDDITALIDAFGEGEHPIATAILGAVLIEHDLEQLLRSKLKHKDDETWAMLIADNGPLNSFYAKIVLGYTLGIYDKRVHGDLHIVRNVRNAFAHSKKLIQFDHPAVVAELRKASRSALPKARWKLNDAKRCYAILCLRLSSRLSQIQSRRTKRQWQRFEQLFERKVREANLLLAGLAAKA
jgi:DNA-binding MltR family transcriptional regulator